MARNYSRTPSSLFAEGNLVATLDAHLARVPEKTDAIPKSQFLASSDEDIAEHLYSAMLIQPIELYEDSKVMEQEEIRLEVTTGIHRNIYGDTGPGPFSAVDREPTLVPGNRVIVSIPFTGDPALWKLKPSHYKNRVPYGIIHPLDRDGIGHLDIVVEQRADAPAENVKRGLQNTLELVKYYLENQRRDIDRKNDQLSERIHQAIQARRERLEKQEGIAKLLDIPLKHREGAPTIEPIRVKRRLIHPLPPPPKSGFKPEPGITDDSYEDILTIIRHEGRTFESTPSTYVVHDEDDLRNMILAHLNGHYRGGATGETFRGKGKTDIRIEAENRAAFVAECKVWRGAQALTKAVDQLLGYLTWRDCKAALIVFNKHNAKFSDLLEKVPSVIREHERLHKDLRKQGEGEWRFILTSEEDEARRITVHVFVFNLYAKE